ncbi:LuxR C-terminal-related transcriptional regulator [Hyphococcus flavus]|uniref:LuxR C-terminal-related transcriptional regulator n=1 Tax=Hyphococcus flavus TaxID=1866326 RepID=A0AAE9ZEE3_9PROT|nr:LuxR family transcriptional regulator [Hyphococcus flavus]WDI33121.1 LuxR C-terminal-related transcriptional regulator [Hyphococcus flavus]
MTEKTFSVDSFIQRSAEIVDFKTLVKLFRELLSALGFESISYYVVRQSYRSVSAKEGARVEEDVEIADALFGAGRSVDFDPVISAMLEKLEPFHWFIAEENRHLSDEQRRVFKRLRAEGFVDGIAVPVMRRPGELAVFTLSKRGKTFSFTKTELRKLQIACHAMHLRSEELIDGKGEAPLSKRETEVMRLVARGMTNREIAEALKLSSHTVDTLIRRCFSKLGVTNRIEASIMFTFRDKLSA